MTATRPKARSRRRAAEAEPTGGGVNTNVLVGVGVAIVAVVLAAIVIFAVAGGDDGNDIGTTEVAAAGQIEVSGEPLPPFEASTDDPAIGAAMPEITAPVLGAGNRITYGDTTGRPRAVIFLAHWCPHCQNEVAAITDWLDQGNQFPAGVDIQSISFLVDEGRGNFPVSDWLRNEGWPYPTVVDDGSGTLGTTFGAAGTPFYVFVNADGTIAGRTSGEMGPDTFAALLEQLEAGEPLTSLTG